MPYDCTNATLVKSTTAKINAMQMIALATIVIVTVIMQRNFRKPQPASRVSYAACESSRRQGDESERGSAQGIEVKGKKREPSDAHEMVASVSERRRFYGFSHVFYSSIQRVGRARPPVR